MSFISVHFVIYVLLVNLIYYSVPVKYRRFVLLVSSLFYVALYSKTALLLMLGAILISYGYGRMIVVRPSWAKRKYLLALVIAVLLLPLACVRAFPSMIAPIGLSFYTLSLISYIVDVYQGKYGQEESLGKFVLFATFFPQSVQGPIARYDKIAGSLLKEHKFNYREFTFGWQLILWGYFLKFVVADKAGIMVNTVYGNCEEFPGFYLVFAALLYSIQLYADFSGCVNIALGVAQSLGISLQPNFRQPYFAGSIQDFWRRWHMTLSTWLKDYIYIPLGGNRHGTVRKYVNILIVFGISGIWHGAGITFLLWGLLHGLYQIVERYFIVKNKIWTRLRTFLMVTFAWILFRAESMQHFFSIIKNMFAAFNPQAILNGDAYYRMGLSRVQTLPLIFGIVLLLAVDFLHEKKEISIRAELAKLPLVVRWGIFLAGIMMTLILGTYGPAYADNQFIYGKF